MAAALSAAIGCVGGCVSNYRSDELVMRPAETPQPTAVSTTLVPPTGAPAPQIRPRDVSTSSGLTAPAAPVSHGVDLSNPRAAMGTYYRSIAIGDAGSARAAVDGDEMAMRYVDAAAAYSAGAHALDDAISTRFGSIGSRENEAFAHAMGRLRFVDASRSIAESDVRLSGDTAIVSPRVRARTTAFPSDVSPADPVPAVLRNTGDGWKLLIGAMSRHLYGKQARDAEAAIELNVRSGETMKQLARAVTAGKFKSAGEVWETAARDHDLAIAKARPVPPSAVKKPGLIAIGPPAQISPAETPRPEPAPPTPQRPVVEPLVQAPAPPPSVEAVKPQQPDPAAPAKSDPEPPTAAQPASPEPAAPTPPAPEPVKPAPPDPAPKPAAPPKPQPQQKPPQVASITPAPSAQVNVTPPPPVPPHPEPAAPPATLQGPPAEPQSEAAVLESLNRDRIAVLRSELSKSGDIEAKDPLGRTALHRAAIGGELDITQLLLDKGADIEAKDNQGWTPLHWAASSGQPEVAKALLAKGAKVDAKGEQGDTPLQWAVIFNRREVAELLVAKGAEIGARDGHRRTALHTAAEHDSTASAEFLLDKGADVNARDDNGLTPLHVAIMHGRLTLSNLQLAGYKPGADGAKPQGKDSDPDAAAAHEESLKRNLELIELILSRGADVNAVTPKGATSLHLATWDGMQPVAQALIAHGADLSARDQRGKTPLGVAAEHEQKQAVAALTAAGAKE